MNKNFQKDTLSGKKRLLCSKLCTFSSVDLALNA